jgi:hypothetical protein
MTPEKPQSDSKPGSFVERFVAERRVVGPGKRAKTIPQMPPNRRSAAGLPPSSATILAAKSNICHRCALRTSIAAELSSGGAAAPAGSPRNDTEIGRAR